jgi:hypothetical protein
MSSRLPLRHYRHSPRFLRDTLAIRRQLQSTPGLIGYALDASITRKTFRTMSAWTDDDHPPTFVRTDPHRSVMARIHPLMDKPAFAFFRRRGRDLPPDWHVARAPLHARATRDAGVSQ